MRGEVGWDDGGGELRVLVCRGLRPGIEVRIDTSPTDQMAYCTVHVPTFLVIIIQKVISFYF